MRFPVIVQKLAATSVNIEIKVQLAPKFFLPFMKTTSFPYYFREKIISIDKISPILQAFEFVISCPTTEHGGIWVGPLPLKRRLTGFRALKNIFGVFVLHIFSKMDKTSI